jgi:hypothetical protein
MPPCPWLTTGRKHTTCQHWPSSTPLGGPSSSPPAKRIHLYVDAVWEAPKWRDEAPTASPAYDVVAALRDVFGELVGNAKAAIAEAGDPDPDDG